MKRCEYCGRFMKDGLFGYIEHIDTCAKTNKAIADTLMPQSNEYVIAVGPKSYDAINKLFDDYFKERIKHNNHE